MVKNSFSSFIISLFAELEISNITYVIIRNYKDYPDAIGGDIDLSINKKQRNEVIKLFKKIVKKYNYCIIRQLNFPHMISLKIVNSKKIGQGRAILAFDLFFGFTYRGLEYINFNELLKYKKRYKNFYVLDDYTTQLITLIHYLFYNNNIPEKYRYKIKEHLNKFILPHSLNNIVLGTVLNKIQSTNFNWEELLANRKNFLNKLLLQNIKKSPITMIILVFSTFFLYFKKIFILNKFVIIIESANNETPNKFINSLLVWVNKYHIFSKSSNIIDKLSLLNVFKILKTTFNEGLIILFINKNNVLVKRILFLLNYTVIHHTFNKQNDSKSKVFLPPYKHNIIYKNKNIKYVIIKTLFFKYCKGY